ncbi:PREDICTED: peptide transporter family 1 isoform X2 [Polistes dominula]|uniref:Peptide transporter family 1 isoform X2 n=1 Tax=Polistes dominula TaxID=743375 RepID=A0ABM1HUC3_POLDO|nr:PREDICTED: peptide transporter family 1 isoform X2 [Polistes dominula]
MTEERKLSENEIQDHPDRHSDVETTEKKLKYPKSVFFIISNEFCERFSFYGMRTVLTLYLANTLNYDASTSTVIYHVFSMFVYFFPLFGGILADSILGKFRTIFYISIIYAVGQFLLALSAVPSIGIPPREIALLGLFLIAVGSGGIKPCVAAFGGDQFVLPQQEQQLSNFFSVFYFSINSGSLISSFLTPILRSSVTCFGEKTCYSLSFLIPAILMSISIVIFAVGKPLYKIVDLKGNVVVDVSKCICYAIKRKIKSKEKMDHWLDYAADKYGQQLVDDIKDSLRVLKMFLPLPIFWALFDQQGSRWTIQASRMDGEIGNFLIQPDQMQVFNPLLVVIFIPIFEICIYPVFAKIRLLNTPLKKLTIGGLLAALSFVISAIVELQLEKTYPILPTEGVAQIRIFNTMNCKIPIKINDKNYDIDGLDYWKDINIDTTNGDANLECTFYMAECIAGKFINNQNNDIISRNLTIPNAKAISFAITPNGVQNGFNGGIEKPKKGLPIVHSLIYLSPESIKSYESSLNFYKDSKLVEVIKLNKTIFKDTSLDEVTPDKYDIYFNKKKLLSNKDFKLGGVYTIIGYDLPEIQKTEISIITVTPPNSMHLMWLLPQYIVITMAEVLFSVTGLEFAFTQSPPSMKSLMQSSWLLTVAFGNLIVVIIAKVSFFNRQVYEFFLFAGLMFAFMILFSIMTLFYKYTDVPETDGEDIVLEEKNGTINQSYKDDEQ